MREVFCDIFHSFVSLDSHTHRRFGLEGALKILSFQPPAMDRDTMLCLTRFFRVVVGFKVYGKLSSSLQQWVQWIPCSKEHHRGDGSCGRAASDLLGAVSSHSHLCTALSWTMIQDYKGICTEFSTKLKP